MPSVEASSYADRASKRISSTQRSFTFSSNSPEFFEKDSPTREFHRCAAELEIHVVHGDLAVIENKPAVHVFHGQLDRCRQGRYRAAATASPPGARSTRAAARSRYECGPDGLGRPDGATWTSASTSLAPDGLIVGQLFFQAGGSASLSSPLNGRFSRFQVDVDFERIFAVWKLGPWQLLDTSAGLDLRLAVVAAPCS